LNGEGEDSKNIRKNIWSYNSMFSFTSIGGIVDKKNKQRQWAIGIPHAWPKLSSHWNSTRRYLAMLGTSIHLRYRE